MASHHSMNSDLMGVGTWHYMAPGEGRNVLKWGLPRGSEAVRCAALCCAVLAALSAPSARLESCKLSNLALNPARPLRLVRPCRAAGRLPVHRGGRCVQLWHPAA